MSKSPPVVVIDMRRDRPPDDGVEHACWVCLDAHDPHGAAATRTGCACRGSAGYAHLSCLIAAARHKEGSFQACHDAWTTCPACKQQYHGPMELGMAQTRWNDCHDRPEDDEERLSALGALAATLRHTGRGRAALPLRRDLLATLRRISGDEPDNDLKRRNMLRQMLALANQLTDMGDDTAAMPLLDEALPGCLRVCGEDAHETVVCMAALARARSQMGQQATARLMFEQAVRALRHRGAAADVTQFVEVIANAGTCLVVMIGDFQAGNALMAEAAARSRQVFGDGHPMTRNVIGRERQMRQSVADKGSGACACGRIMGLTSRPELNGKEGIVVGFANGRYCLNLDRDGGVPASSTQPLVSVRVKPKNFALAPGTAVIVEGLGSQLEWNGKRGLVKSFDHVEFSYELLFEGRELPLGVQFGCCVLESLAGQEEAAGAELDEAGPVDLGAAVSDSAPEPEAAGGTATMTVVLARYPPSTLNPQPTHPPMHTRSCARPGIWPSQQRFFSCTVSRRVSQRP